MPSPPQKQSSSPRPPVSRIPYGIRNENPETWSTARTHSKPNPLRIRTARVVGTLRRVPL